MKRKISSFLLIGLMIGLMGICCYLFWEPLRYFVSHPQMMREQGIFGIVVFVVVIMLQIILAFLPGEMLEVMAGLVYGPWWGLLLCMLGAWLGSSCIYFLVKRFGVPLIQTFFPKSNLQELAILKNEKRLYSLCFIIFLIPGTPKDLLTYVMPLTRLNYQEFFLITTFARIPSIITSTLGGDLLASQNYLTAVVVFIVTGLVALVGMQVYKKTMVVK